MRWEHMRRSTNIEDRRDENPQPQRPCTPNTLFWPPVCMDTNKPMPRGEGTPQRQSQSDSTGGDNAQVAAATDTSASAQRDYSAAVAALNEMTNTGELSSDFPSAEQLLGPSEAA